MGKASGSHRRSKKQYQYTVNRKRLQKSSNKKPKIRCEAIKNAYDTSIGMSRNMRKMGLSHDPNKTIKIQKAQNILEQTYKPHGLQKKLKASEPYQPTGKELRKSAKPSVAKELEEQAKKHVDSTFHLSNEIALFAQYMTQKYGDDYKSMAKDVRNYYQSTPKQIKRRIADYNSSQMVTAMKMAKKAGDEVVSIETV